MNAIPLLGNKKGEENAPPPPANLPPPSYTPSSTIHHLNKKSKTRMELQQDLGLVRFE